MKNLLKTIISIIPFLILIILGYVVCSKSISFSKQQLNMIYYAPYVILLLAAVIAYKFNRSRYFFIAVISTISLLIFYFPLKITIDSIDLTMILCILLPFNVVAFALLKERGILSLWGILRFGFLLLQAGIVVWLTAPPQQNTLSLINRSFFPAPLNPLISIPHIALLLFLIAFAILSLRIMLYQSSQDITIMGVLITLFCMLNGNKTIGYSVFLTVIGMILLVSILRDTYFMAFFDELTSLPSRRALNQDLMKLGMKYTIAMLDIDFFKKFNDTYGHDTGDEVLRFVSSIIKDVKGGGKAYRYGGEEFTIIFSGKSKSDIMPVLDELREAIADRGFVVRPKRRVGNSSNSKSKKNTKRRGSSSNRKKVYIHVSIGVANRDDTLKTPAMVMKAADAALYRAKKKGRNCVSK